MTTKKTIILSSSVFVITLAVLFGLTTSPQQVQQFYYTKINPHAGAVQYEKEWQSNYNGAAAALTEENVYVDKMQSDSNITAKQIPDLVDKMKGIMAKRDAYFSEMVRIDHDTAMLNLPQSYRDFYVKRLAADQKDYDAFNVYSAGMTQILDGTKTIYQFSGDYEDAMGAASALGDSGKNYSNFSKVFDYTAEKLNGETGDLTAMESEGILSQGIVAALNEQNQNVMVIKKMNDAWQNGDKAGYAAAYGQMETMLQQSPPDWETLITLWGKEKRKVFMTKQDSLHDEATKLYNRAYLYAKDQKLNDILSVWGKNLPGTLTPAGSGTVSMFYPFQS